MRVFEKGVLRRIFSPKREEVTDVEKRCIMRIRIMKPRRMRWAGHAARMGKKHAYRISVGKPEGKSH
jgi:hypothetical protein